MTTIETDLLQTLDRRTQVDRVLALDPLRAIGTDADATTPARANASATDRADPGALTSRLPLGRLVAAHVVEVLDGDHVVADVEQWRVSLAWPRGAGAVLPGQALTLRVLAHRPMLLFQNVDAAGDVLDALDASPTRWSAGALALARSATALPSQGGRTATVFTEPILDIEIVASSDVPAHADRTDAVVENPGRQAFDQTGAEIALGDVIVARTPDEPIRDPGTLPPMPIVLQGPAWPGQAVELVVRRQRADEELDNAALDQWCGEIVIDLPTLGRVAVICPSRCRACASASKGRARPAWRR